MCCTSSPALEISTNYIACSFEFDDTSLVPATHLFNIIAYDALRKVVKWLGSYLLLVCCRKLKF
jgi:hypothetical protein